jgi:hypothetical protein
VAFRIHCRAGVHAVASAVVVSSARNHQASEHDRYK